MPSPVGIKVPFPGSSCFVCRYRGPDFTCKSRSYVQVRYKGKIVGDNRYIDGKTGNVVRGYITFCCNFFDTES